MGRDCRSQFVLVGLWRQIRDIRHGVQRLLAGFSEVVQNSAVVAVSELLENAVKYGVPTTRMDDVLVDVEVKDKKLTIRVSNQCDDAAAIERLREHVAKINDKQDPYDVILQRIKELNKDHGKSMGLGIYRIAAEGGFSMSLEIKDDVVTVVANRIVDEEV